MLVTFKRALRQPGALVSGERSIDVVKIAEIALHSSKHWSITPLARLRVQLQPVYVLAVGLNGTRGP